MEMDFCFISRLNVIIRYLQVGLYFHFFCFFCLNVYPKPRIIIIISSSSSSSLFNDAFSASQTI
jgi:hypothetical protein